MGRMKDLLITIYNGGDEAVAAVERMGKDWREQLEQAAAEIERRWIPVGERLPEEDRLVLWYRPDERWPVSAGRFCKPRHVDEGGDLAVPFSEGLYTHWMPLPALPTE